jgi:ribonuclease HI
LSVVPPARSTGGRTVTCIERLDDNALNIFTDGSQLSNPRRGGCGFILVTTDENGEEEIYESRLNGSKGSTNQEMEIKAAVEALKLVLGSRSPVQPRRFGRIVVYTDSQFLVDGAGSSVHSWSKQGWNRRGGARLVNTQLWQELLRLRKRSPIPVFFEWRKGKSSRFTKLVDRLAKESAKRPYDRPPTIRSLAQKNTDEPVDPEFIPLGEVITIKIVESMNNRLQRRWRFKYEVVSEGPTSARVATCLDVICSVAASSTQSASTTTQNSRRSTRCSRRRIRRRRVSRFSSKATVR